MDTFFNDFGLEFPIDPSLTGEALELQNQKEDAKDLSNALIVVYFSFTSLSTVGFGDFHPRGNSERIVGAFIMLFGVAITSFCMENFSQMIIKFK